MAEEEIEISAGQEELYEHHRIVCDPGQMPLRIDKFLFGKLANVSRNKIQNAAKASCILVNESPVKSNYKIDQTRRYCFGGAAQSCSRI